MVKRSMGPVWEANHVWLIFVLVIFWTGFPDAFGAVMATLYVPLFLAAVGIIFRGAAFALRGEAATIGEARVLGATFALSSVLVPFFFGAASGRSPPARCRSADGGGDAIDSWTGLVPIYVGVLAVATGAYLAAVFLAADASRAGSRTWSPPSARARWAPRPSPGRSRSGGSSSSATSSEPLRGLTSGPGSRW